jgi:hypothetical protein
MLTKPIKKLIGNLLGLYSINEPAPKKNLFTYVDKLVRREVFAEGEIESRILFAAPFFKIDKGRVNLYRRRSKLS